MCTRGDAAAKHSSVAALPFKLVVLILVLALALALVVVVVVVGSTELVG